MMRSEIYKFISLILWVGAFFMVGMMLSYQDFSSENLKLAMKLKFSQLWNILWVWLPILLFDAATPGKTLEAISVPDTPIEKLATALFYGLMGLATCFAFIWGS